MDYIVPEIRSERANDKRAIHEIYVDAFGQDIEANLVDRLRESCSDYLSFVAVDDEKVVGHILFTPVTLAGSKRKGMGLAPMAVLPECQNQGIGAQLVRYGLDYLRKFGCPFVIVLGHPTYYPRFGFEPASNHKLSCQWGGVPDEAFMVVVFDQEAMPAEGGVVRYRPEFDAAM